METWPSTLPAIHVDNIRLEPVDGVARSAMDSGATRMRRRFTTSPDVYSVRWVMTTAQFDTFEGWFENLIAAGAEPFTVALPCGDGIVDMTAQFLETWTATPRPGGSYWEIAARLYVTDRPRTI